MVHPRPPRLFLSVTLTHTLEGPACHWGVGAGGGFYLRTEFINQEGWAIKDTVCRATGCILELPWYYVFLSDTILIFQPWISAETDISSKRLIHTLMTYFFIVNVVTETEYDSQQQRYHHLQQGRSAGPEWTSFNFIVYLWDFAWFTI